VLGLCARLGITARETSFSLHAAYNASEAFVTGTLAGLAPVARIDGRAIGDGAARPVLARLQQAYREEIARYIAEEGPRHAR